MPHTYAAFMIAAGVNAEALSTYIRHSNMGHSSITATLDRYGHLMPGNEVEAAVMLEKYLRTATRVGCINRVVPQNTAASSGSTSHTYATGHLPRCRAIRSTSHRSAARPDDARKRSQRRSAGSSRDALRRAKPGRAADPGPQHSSAQAVSPSR
jgi:hypothetical protein